jgi:hypothetical protein
MAYTFKSGSTPNAAAAALGGSWKDLVYKFPNGTIVKGSALNPNTVPIGTIAYTQAEYDGTTGGGGSTSTKAVPKEEGPGQGGVYTRSQVSSWFTAAGVTIEIKDGKTVIETAEQRLDRLVFQLNSGGRTETEVLQEIYNGTGKTIESGAKGAALLTETYGGSPEIWYDKTSGEWYLAYGVPGTDIPLLYSISTAELKVIFPDSKPVADRSITTNEIKKLGGIFAGTAEDPFGDPYADFIDQLEKEAKIKPWLKDADMLAIMFEATLEGRQPTEAELSQTNWWKTHSEAERAWLTMSLYDPSTSEQMITDARLGVRQALVDAGVSNATEDIINYMAGEWVQGRWSEIELQSQIKGLSDPSSGITLDEGLSKIIADTQITLDTTSQYEERVRTEVLKWLGPVHGEWTDNQIASWAGKLRNDPDGMEALTQMLRGQRTALFPEYANENLTYEDIAGPWRNMVSNTWGETPDETDPFFSELVRLNDYAEAGKRLRKEGLIRNVGKVSQDIERAGASANQQYRPVG